MATRYTTLLISSIFMLASSCANYYLTTDSLRTQFAGIDSTKLIPVTMRGGVKRYEYLANPISVINCVDKRGNPAQLKNGPSIEMRVTEVNGKRSIFYFDRILVTDSTLYGVQSRFIDSIKKTLRLKDIKKIEIQDGKKNFDYVAKKK